VHVQKTDPQRQPGRDRRDSAAPGHAPRRHDAYLLSGDDNLLLELGPLLGDEYRTRPIDSADALQEAGATPWLVIIDATARHDARAVVARIEQQHALAPLIVLCADGRSTDWASPLSRGTVCAVLERRQLAGTGLRDALLVAEQRFSALASQTTATSLDQLRASQSRPDRGARWLLVTVTLVLAAGGVWWYLHNHGAVNAPPPAVAPATPASTTASAPSAATPGAPTASTTPTTPTAPTAPATSARSTLELLSAARVAFRDEKTLLPRADTPPAGDSALELYAQVLTQEPQNDEARDGMRRLFSVARARIQSDLTAGKLDEATRLLGAFRNVGLDAAATSKLEADIAAARPRWLVAQARTALANGELDTATQLIAQIAAGGADRTLLADLHHTLETRTADAQMAELAARARSSIVAGALLDPPTDSARTRLLSMQQLSRTHPLTLAVQHELQSALLSRALADVRTQQVDLAQQNLTAAAEYGNTPELLAARKQLQTDTEERAARAAAIAAPPIAPPVTAAPSAPVPPAYLSAKPTRPLDAVFPANALRQGLTGHVIVEFMLDAKGRALEPRVIESAPAGTFDAAAIQAVRSGRYDTAPLNGSTQPRRARLLVSFK